MKNLATLAEEQTLNGIIHAARGYVPAAKKANAVILKSRQIGYQLPAQKPTHLRAKNAFNNALTAFAVTPLILAFALVMHIFAGL
jgi:hypothetical protein